MRECRDKFVRDRVLAPHTNKCETELRMADEQDDDRTYIVLINEEEQYSLWLKDKKIPAGWKSVGKEGTKAECVSYVDSVWTDMRPLSLRKKMDSHLS